MYPHARVSEILGMFRDYAGIDKRVLDEKCAIGDETHQNIYLDSQDIPPYFDNHPVRDFSKKPDLPIKRWERRGRPYFESYLMWKEKHNPQYLMQETRFKCDELMITGQFDAIIATDDKPMLIDYKCSATADEQIWGMQAHFYYYLLKQNGVEIGDKFQWLKLNVKKEKICKYPELFDAMNAKNEEIAKSYSKEEIENACFEWITKGVYPTVIEIPYNDDVMQKCIDAAVLYWQLKRDARCVA